MSTARGERRLRLAASRELLYSVPLGELFELPGRPHVVYQIRSYASTDNIPDAVQAARNDVPFLFKSFETGQIGPKRMAKMHGGKPRMATIHEYLDWTVTAQKAQEDDELDFGGFRVVVILPRYVSHWPSPDSLSNQEGKKVHPNMGAPMLPYPLLQTHGKPVSAATIRSGPGYLEVPFVATHEGKRGRGYCRCLVEAIEDIARALKLPELMLCSTNDDSVKSTWYHLGFDFASEEEMERWDVPHSDLVYLQNTTQMHKQVPPPGRYKPILIKQGDYKLRTYLRFDKPPVRPRLSFPPKKAPPKKGHAHHGAHHAVARHPQSQGLGAMHHPFAAHDGMMGMGAQGSAGSMQAAVSDASWRSDMNPEVSSASGGMRQRRGHMRSMVDESQSGMQWAPPKGMAPASMHLPPQYAPQLPYPVTTSHPFSQPQHPGAMPGPHYPMQQQPASQHPTSWGGPTSYGPCTQGSMGPISGLPPVSSQHSMAGMHGHGPMSQAYNGPQGPGMGPGMGVPGYGGAGMVQSIAGLQGGPHYGGMVSNPMSAVGGFKAGQHGQMADMMMNDSSQMHRALSGAHDVRMWSGSGRGVG